MASVARLVLCSLTLGLLTHPVFGEPLHLVTSNYPPYCYEDGGQVRGIAVELVKEAFSRMHRDIRISFVPFPRALAMVKDGSADGIFPVAIRDDRKEFIHYPSETLLSDPSALFVGVNSTITFDGDFAKLANYTIGMQRGTDHGAAFMKAIQTNHLRIDEASDQEQNVLKLVQGRFDIAVGPRLVVLDAARRVGKSSAIKVLYSPLSEGAVFVAFSKRENRTEVIAKFDQVFRQIRNDGSYKRIAGALPASTK